MKLGIVGRGRQGQRWTEVARQEGHAVAWMVGGGDFCRDTCRDICRDVDAVIAATMPDWHAEVARECLRQRRPALIDKPFATSAAAAAAVRDHDLGSSLVAFHPWLFDPALRELLNAATPRSCVEVFACGPVHPGWSPAWDWGPHGAAVKVYLHTIDPLWPVRLHVGEAPVKDRRVVTSRGSWRDPADVGQVPRMMQSALALLTSDRPVPWWASSRFGSAVVEAICAVR